MNNQEYKEWEKEVPFLASLPVRNPFMVPEGYFTAAGEDAAAQLSITFYAGKRPHTGFSVPEGYFGLLSDQIMARVTAEAFRPEESGFSLPAGYFESLSARIMEKAAATAATPVKEARVIRLWGSDLMKYASAACVILVTAATLFFNQQQYKLDQTSTADMYSGEAYKEQMLYDIDEDMIIEHIQSTANAVKTVPQEQLEAYILDNYSSNEIAQGM